MAFSKTQIINRSLVRCGARPITNVETDETDEAVTALNIYDITLETLLSETLWTFATKRKLLATLAQTIPFNREYETLEFVYQRPVGVIRIFGTNDTAAYWLEEGDTIVSDTAGLGIIYTFRNTNTATYPSAFVSALSDKLVEEMSYAILNSGTRAREALELYEGISLPKAKSENAQIGTAKQLNDAYWINARHGGPNVNEFS